MDWSPLFISLKIAVLSTGITLILALALAGITRNASKKIRWVTDTIVTLPMVLPPTATGFFLLMAMGRHSAIGKFLASINVQLVFTWQAGVIAAVVVSMPLAYQAIKAAMEKVDKEQIWAARTLGFSEGRIFYRLIIPQSWPGIFSGLVLAFARSLGEFGATMMVAGNIPGKTQTMSLAVYFATAAGKIEVAALWTAIITVISFTVLGIINLRGGEEWKV